MTFRMKLQGWRVGVTAAAAGALLLGSPMIPTASAQPAGTRTPSAAVGNTYGGLTRQGQPLVIDMTADRRHLVRAVTVLEMTCTSGNSGLITDRYPRMPVSKGGRFHYAFGPTTDRNDDGTSTDFQGRLTGRLNDARTKAAGTWTYSFTEHDAAGAVTDTCTSGPVPWTAKQ
jgi:hypothetical protein